MNPRTKSLYERWRKRVALWQRSGLTAAEFAANADLDPEMLRHWKAILDQDASVMSMPPRTQASQAPTPLSLLELRPGLSITDERCEIDLGDGRRLRVPPSFDAAALRRILAALQEKA